MAAETIALIIIIIFGLAALIYLKFIKKKIRKNILRNENIKKYFEEE